jgi:hypothetical protein
MHGKKLNLPREKIDEAVKATDSMKAAADYLGVTYSSFGRYATKFGLYVPNQGGRGRSKPKTDGKGKRSLSEVLQRNTHYNSATLRKRLIAEGLKADECEDCGQPPVWNDKPLVMHLDHVDGDHANNELGNLRILCPNCHTQTSTYCRGQYRSGKKTLVN